MSGGSNMFDLAILGGTVIEPVDKKLITANVYIKDGKIAEVTRMTYGAKKIINAHGMYVSPGFIDMHTHTENNSFISEMLTRQGVTTVINGNCGFGQRDLANFFDKVDKGSMLNLSQLVGASELRDRAGQTDPYAPMSEEQIKFAEQALLADLEAGASGLSFGLAYVPGSSKEETLRLAQIVARYGKLVAIHPRGNGWNSLGGIEEVVDISRKTGASVHLSHVVYNYGYGIMQQALELIDNAVCEGIDISCDSGMYTSYATLIGSDEFSEKTLELIRCPIENIYMATGKHTGQNLISREMYLKMRESCPDDVAIAIAGNPHEILMAFNLPYMMCSSDAGVGALAGIDTVVHPQDASNFAKFLLETVVMNKMLTLADAISRITWIPAQRMGLKDKGRIIPGADADITIFELEKINERADFPHLGKSDAPPEGFNTVIIGGKIVVNKNKIESQNSGKLLRSPNIEWRL